MSLYSSRASVPVARSSTSGEEGLLSSSVQLPDRMEQASFQQLYVYKSSGRELLQENWSVLLRLLKLDNHMRMCNFSLSTSGVVQYLSALSFAGFCIYIYTYAPQIYTLAGRFKP